MWVRVPSSAAFGIHIHEGARRGLLLLGARVSGFRSELGRCGPLLLGEGPGRTRWSKQSLNRVCGQRLRGLFRRERDGDGEHNKRGLVPRLALLAVKPSVFSNVTSTSYRPRLCLLRIGHASGSGSSFSCFRFPSSLATDLSFFALKRRPRRGLTPLSTSARVCTVAVLGVCGIPRSRAPKMHAVVKMARANSSNAVDHVHVQYDRAPQFLVVSR